MGTFAYYEGNYLCSELNLGKIEGRDLTEFGNSCDIGVGVVVGMLGIITNIKACVKCEIH